MEVKMIREPTLEGKGMKMSNNKQTNLRRVICLVTDVALRGDNQTY